MDRNKEKAKITNCFSKTKAQNEKSLDHVQETSKTPAASEASFVYNNLASAGLEENMIEQPIEQHTSQGKEERQWIPNKPNKPRNIIFPLRNFAKQKRAISPKWFDQFKCLHHTEENN